jgi:hypothetical protein
MGTALQAVGPVAGGLVRGAGAVARNVGRGLDNAFSGGSEVAAARRGAGAMQDELADLAGRAAGAEGGSIPPRNPLNALRGEVREPRGVALELMAEDLRAGGNDPSELLRRLEAGDIADDLEVTPLELGRGPVRRTADVSTIASKEGDAVLLPRLAQRQSRIGRMAGRSLERVSGRPNVPAHVTLNEMVLAQRAAAEPAYRQAYAYGQIRNPETIARVNALLQRSPDYRDAYEMARRLAAEDGVNLPILDMGNGQLAELPTVEALDKWKQGLDEVINTRAQGKGAIPPQLAIRLRRNLDEVIRMVDDEVPAYRTARQTFGDDAAIIEAFEAGRAVDRGRLDQLRERLGAVPPIAGDAYRQGAVATLQEEIAMKGPNELLGELARGRDIVQAVFSNGAQRAKYEAALGPDVVRQMAEEFVQMAEMAASNQAVGKGSQTARRIAGDIPALNESVAQKFAENPTNPMAAALQAALGTGRSGLAAGVRGLTPDVATQYSILSGVGAGPGERASLIQLMRDVIEREAMAQQRNVRRTQQVGSVAGRLGGMTQ